MKRSFSRIATAAAALFAFALPVSAGTLYWNGQNLSGTGQAKGWNNKANWSTSSSAASPTPAAVPGSADTASFNISSVNTAQTVGLFSNPTVLGLAFTSTGTVTINDGSSTMTLGIGSGGLSIAATAGAVSLSNSSIALSATQSWNNSSASPNVLTIGGGVTNSAASGTVTLNLTNSGTGGTTFNGIISNNGNNGALTSLNINTTAGTTTLAGTNTFTGGTTLTAGNLKLSGTGTLGSSSNSLTVNGGTLDLNGVSATVGNFTGTGGTIVNNAASGTATLSIGSGSTATTGNYQGTIADHSTGNGTVAVTKLGTGTITLSGPNTYSGLTTVSAGTLAYGANDVLGSGGVTVNGTGAVLALGSSHTDTVGTVTLTNGSITGTGTSALTSTGTFEMQNGSVSAILAGTNIPLNKSGTGTVTLSGVNTYTGNTSITNGTLTVATIGAQGANGNLGAGTTITLGSNTSSGTLKYTGTGESTNRVINLNAGAIGFGGTIDQSGTGTVVFTSDLTATSAGPNVLTLQGSTAGAGLFGGKIVDGGLNAATSVVKTGTSTWALTANNTYTGGTTINGGLLVINNVVANSGDSGTGSAAVTVNATASLGGGAGQANGGTFDPTTGTFLSGQIGTIAGSVTVAANGVIAPGNSVGTLTVGGLTLQTGALGSFEFNTTTANNTTVALSNDFVNVTGTNALTLPSTGVASISVYQEGTTNGYSLPGTYHVFGYSGAVQNEVLDGNSHISNLQVSNPVNGFTYYFVDNSALHTIDLVIIVTPAPQFTSVDHTTFTVGTAGSFDVTTSHPLGLNRDVTESGALPSGVSFTAGPAGSGTATISGTPDIGTGGVYTITLTATDTSNMSTQQIFTLTVNEAPTVSSSPSATFQTGNAASFTVTTSHSYPIPTITETGALPSGVTFVDNHNGTATLSGTAGAATGGSYSLTITATNAAATAQQSFTLTVNQAPSFTSANNTTFTARAAGTFSVTASGFPKPSISTSSTLPSGVTLLDNGNGTATLSGTPAAGSGGVYTISLSAANGIGSNASQTFTLTVREVSITSSSSTSFAVGTPGSFTVTTHFYPATPIPALTLKSGANTLPSGVTFHDNADGTATISGTAVTGSEGAYNITIQADNGLAGQSKLSDAQNFTLTVTRPPSFTSAASATFKVGSSGSFSVQVAGFPKPGISAGGALPASISFTDNGNGTATISGTPVAGDGGSYSLTLTATNTINQATQNFTLTVQEAPTITSSPSATFQTGTAGAFTLTTGHVYPAPPTITSSGTLPSGVTFLDKGDGTATLSGTPAANAGGSYPLTITAKNGATPDATQNFTLTVNQPSAITSANSAAFPVGIATTFTVTTTGYPINTISEPETLPTGLSFTDNHDGTATITGTAATGTEGSYDIHITAANGVATAAQQTFTIVINSSPVFTSANTSTFTVGAPGTFSITTTHNGGSDPAITYTGALPTGVQLVDNGNGTATLSGTPSSGTGGTYPLSLKASNGVPPDATQTFTLTVNEAPSIAASPTPAPFVTGTAGSFTITTTGFPKPTITELGTLPSGVTFHDNGDGTATVSGTPASNAGGSYPFTINASNVAGAATAQAFTLQVNQPAGITSANNTTFRVGASNSFTVNTSGVPTASVSVVLPNGVTSLPSGVSFVDNGNGTGTLSGTPAVGTGGTYTFSFSATNGIGSTATQSFTLTINEVSITSGSSTAFKVGTAGSFTVTTHFYPATPIPGLTASAKPQQTGLPNGVTFHDNGDGTATISGTPAAGTASTSPYTFTITADNGLNGGAKLTSTQAFSLTVSQAPSITSANTATFKVGTSGNFGIAAGGVPVPAISQTGGTLPTGLTFNGGNGTASISGTAAAGKGGVYTIDIKASNGTTPDATQTITVTVNEAPSITSANSTTFSIGSAGTFKVTTGHSYPANPTLTPSGTLPSGVTFTDNGDGTGTLSGTPNANTGGSYPVTITASNGILPNATQNFTLSVNQAPSITSSGATSFTAGTAGTFTVTAAGFPKPAITKTGALPSGVTLTDNGDGTATLAGTPAAGTGGTYPLSLKASNGVGSDATQSFTLTVDEAPTITSANAATFIVGTSGSFTVTTSHSYPTPTLTEPESLPNGLTFTDNNDGTATIAGTPALTTGGSYTLHLTANNAVSPNGAQTLTLTVNEAPRFTSASSKSFTVGVNGSLTVTTGGYPAITQISETGALPAGISFTDNTDGTATIAGTAQSGTNGTYPIKLTATNGISPDATQDVTITVAFGPQITSANNATFVVGATVNCTPDSLVNCFTVTSTHTSGSTPQVSTADTLPTGVTLLDNGDGTATLSGKPATATGGSYPITLTAHNDTPPDGTQAFTLTVNEAPAFTSTNGTTFTVGGAGSFTITTRGYPAPAITKFSGTLPSGITLHDNGDGTATLGGTPANNTGGSYVITLHAANNIGTTATQTFTLTVDQGAAITSNTSATFKVGTAGTFNITTSGNPKPSLGVTGTLPSGVTFTDNGNGTGKLAGTPATGTGGVYPLTITASNGIGPDGTQSFTLTVNEPTSITSANQHAFTVGKPETFTITTGGGYPANPTISLADHLPSPTKTNSAVLPAGLNFADNHDGTGTISGTPTAATASAIQFVVIANNGQQTTQQFSLTVVEAPFAPVFTSNATTTFTVGASGNFVVTASGSPVPSVTEDANDQLPSGISFTSGNGSGTLAGTPAAGAGGTYQLTFNAANTVLPNATQMFTLIVDEPPAITSAHNTTFAVGSTGTFTVTSTGYPLAAYSITAGSLPQNIIFEDNGDGTATLSGTPEPGSGGIYSFTITASNGVTPDALQSYTLTVTETQPTPTATPSATATPSPTASATPSATPSPTPGQPLNISTRMEVLQGDNVLIAGLIVTGEPNTAKKVMIRGLGPSLAAAGVSNPLSDPLLELHGPAAFTTIVNDNWQQASNTSEIPNGFQPSDSRESVIIADLPIGAEGFASYTAIVKGAHGETGIGLAEAYDLDAKSGEFANISTRGFIDKGDNVMIGGFIIGGSDTGSKVLIRGIGPSLGAAGVSGALADPTLEIHDKNGTKIRSNDNWKVDDATGASQQSLIEETTIPPSNELESAILDSFAPGAYTAIVAGKNQGTGVGLVEVYNIK